LNADLSFGDEVVESGLGEKQPAGFSLAIQTNSRKISY
jgi:cell shape-determining protein MreC